MITHIRNAVFITGANGFIGKNLIVRLRAQSHLNVSCISHEESDASIHESIVNADIIFHFAGVNRTDNLERFYSGNVEFTQTLIDGLKRGNRKPHVIFASSSRASEDSQYALTKRIAREMLEAASLNGELRLTTLELPNIFGKWAAPNYNSFVATACYSIANDKHFELFDSDTLLDLVYIDDLVNFLVQLIDSEPRGWVSLDKLRTELLIYRNTPEEIVGSIREFMTQRAASLAPNVAVPFLKKLYSTFLTYIPTSEFCYSIPSMSDHRGVFKEVLSQISAGQVNFASINPGKRRGGHFHNTKVEKFCVASGQVLFRFQHILTSEYLEWTISSDDDLIIETIPGWAHSVENIGTQTASLIIWASEKFDPEFPDTYTFEGLI